MNLARGKGWKGYRYPHPPAASAALLNSPLVRRMQERPVEPEPPKEDRKVWYAWYLTTPKWDRIRRAVLRRANSACEGCGGIGLALQVHHLTYKHVGNEFLWELVAVCDPCHERVHDK